MEKAAYVLFYGIMALVAVTCAINIGSIRALQTSDWFSAWGSWFGGAASFAAVVVALYIAFRQETVSHKQAVREERLMETIVAYKLSTAARFISYRARSLLVPSIRHHLEEASFNPGMARMSLEIYTAIELSQINELKHVPSAIRMAIQLNERLIHFNRKVEVFCERRLEKHFLDYFADGMDHDLREIRRLCRAIRSQTLSHSEDWTHAH